MSACRVIILAAGTASRLQHAGHRGPKQLAEIAGKSLAERSLAAFVAAGIDDFGVVLGAQAEVVREHYSLVAERLRVGVEFVSARDYELGNGASALSARGLACGESFLLTMSDHLFTSHLIAATLKSPLSGGVGLAVDDDIDSVFDVDDLTKVAVDDGWVTAIGKDIGGWNCGDTGLFRAGDALFNGLDKARADGLHSLSDGVRRCIHDGGVRAIDVSGQCWIDVDTPEALAEAERMLSAGEL